MSGKPIVREKQLIWGFVPGTFCETVTDGSQAWLETMFQKHLITFAPQESQLLDK